MKSLFEAINHCHAQNIIHSDIKLENIMVNDMDMVRLIDFGLAKTLRGEGGVVGCRGTPYYLAPEVIKGMHGTQADIWSLGVILYIMICGFPPFQGESTKEIARKIKAASFNFNHEEFDQVSLECKDLIRKLLTKDPSKRLTGSQALKHAWFKYYAPPLPSDRKHISDEVLMRLSNYRGVSTFKKAVMNLVVKMASEDEIRDLRAQFQAIDLDGTGMINTQELKLIMQKQ